MKPDRLADHTGFTKSINPINSFRNMLRRKIYFVSLPIAYQVHVASIPQVRGDYWGVHAKIDKFVANEDAVHACVFFHVIYTVVLTPRSPVGLKPPSEQLDSPGTPRWELVRLPGIRRCPLLAISRSF